MTTTTPIKDQSFLSPVRVRMPLSSRKRLATPAATPLETPDRFIPNRMISSKSSSFLFSTTAKRRKTTTMADATNTLHVTPGTIQEEKYDQQLRSVLLGKHTNSPSRLMEFGPKTKRRRTLKPTRLFPAEDPFQHDVLRSAPPDDNNDNNRRHRKWTRVSLVGQSILEAPRMHANDELLHLVGAGKDYLAVALDCRLYLWKKGMRPILLVECDQVWTCLQWSQDGELLAVATMGTILVYHQSCGRQPIARMSTYSECTALAWKGRELVAGFTEGEPTARYDLEVLPDRQGETPVQATYEGHGDGEGVVTSVQWHGNTIATAGSDGKIQLFDSGRSAPKRVIEHKGVKSVEFCPQQPNLLVSSGQGGLKFWNTWTGKLRGSIPMEGKTVTAALCSVHRHEILVAHGRMLSLWSLASGQMLYERSVGGTNKPLGAITNMKRGLDGSIVCAHDDERMSLYSFQREVSKETARATVGMMTNIPTLR